MKELSTRPYMIRAIYDWCADSGFTPYIVVKVDRFTKVPMEYVKNGEIVLNLSPDATHKLTLGNDVIQFSARFGGVSREISVPVETVGGIFAKETAQGIFFDTPSNTMVDKPTKSEEKVSPETASDSTPPDTDGSSPQNGGRRRLQVVK
ncbi:MAG: ClpXP protease specificity-enhancing factor [Burkholderiales bacterium]|nr:ClpXP protease specificity-enhancing factor [Burkholderiales bacterium]